MNFSLLLQSRFPHPFLLADSGNIYIDEEIHAIIYANIHIYMHERATVNTQTH